MGIGVQGIWALALAPFFISDVVREVYSATFTSASTSVKLGRQLPFRVTDKTKWDLFKILGISTCVMSGNCHCQALFSKLWPLLNMTQCFRREFVATFKNVRICSCGRDNCAHSGNGKRENRKKPNLGDIHVLVHDQSKVWASPGVFAAEFLFSLWAWWGGGRPASLLSPISACDRPCQTRRGPRASTIIVPERNLPKPSEIFLY